MASIDFTPAGVDVAFTGVDTMGADVRVVFKAVEIIFTTDGGEGQAEVEKCLDNAHTPVQ